MPTLSPSQLAVWQNCQVRWNLSYKEGLVPIYQDRRAMDKGNYIHDLLHYYYALVKLGYPVGSTDVIELIKERISQDLKEVETPDYSFFEECTRVTIKYILDRSPEIDNGLGTDFQVESHLELELENGWTLHGYVDLLYGVIRDHKTGGRNTYNLRAVHRNQQLLFYATIYYKLTGKILPVEINWIHSDPPKTSKNPIYSLVPASFSKEKLEGFYNYLVEMTEYMDNTKTYLPNYSACGSCPFFHICDHELKGLDTSHLRKFGYARKSTEDETSRKSGKGFTLQINS